MQDTATVIAVVAALVAMLSALYARSQAIAAGRANEIALHDSRLRVYNGLVRFRAHISARGTGITEAEVRNFAEVAELSEFYFPGGVSPRLNTVFENALKLLSLNEQWEEARQYDPAKAKTLVEERHTLMRGSRDECYKIGNEPDTRTFCSTNKNANRDGWRFVR